jgi:hypothetical protein
MNRRITPGPRANNNNNAVIDIDKTTRTSSTVRRLALNINNNQILKTQQLLKPKTCYHYLKEKGYRIGRTLGSGSYAKVK